MHDIKKAYALSNAKIQFVSLVDKAANKRQFLITKAEKGTASFQSFGRIVKADGDSHFVTGIVYEPMTEDTDGEYMTEEEIEKAAHWYMKNAGDVDIQHCFVKAENIDVVESYVAKCDMEIEGNHIKKGTWLMTVEVADESVWDSIQKGEITGFSMGGIAESSTEDVDLSNVEKTEDRLVDKLTKALKNVFGSNEHTVAKGKLADNFKERVKSDNLWSAFYVLRDMLESYQYNPDTGEWRWTYTSDPEEIKDYLADFNEIVTQLLTSNDVLGDIEKAATEAHIEQKQVEKAGKSLSNKNLEILQGISTNLSDFLATFSESDEGEVEKGISKKEEEDMTKTEAQTYVDEAVAKAVKPIVEQLESIAKGEEGATGGDEPGKASPEDNTKAEAEDVTKMVEDAVAKAMEPVNQVLDTLRKSRALPSNLNDAPSNNVEKAEEQHYLHGII